MYFHYILQALFVLIGCVSVGASLFNWDWFFNAQNTQFILKRLGRNRSRIFYAFIGVLMIATGIYFFTQVYALH